MQSKENKLNMNKIYIKLIWLLIGPVFYALFRLAFLWPEFVEAVYSRGIFRFLNQGLSTVTGILPFSLAELFLYAFAIFVAIYIVIMIIKSIQAKKTWWFTLLNRFLILLTIFSFVYAAFVGMWAFNYARQPLGKTLELDTTPATVSELYSTSESIVEKANDLRENVPENADGVFSPANTKQDIMRSVEVNYNNTALLSGYDFLGGSYGQAKPVLYSTGLSYANVTGVYFPFTAEANVNADVPMLLFAATSFHESAHQRGFSREDEANFLAYFVSSYSDDASIEYSGTMLALIHSMNKLYEADRDLYYELRSTYSEGINRDLDNNSLYWQQFESPINEASQAVNNTFLRANMQKDGVKSYGRMVDLLIGLWRDKRI